MYQITFTAQNSFYDDVAGNCRLSISRENKSELLLKEIVIPSGSLFKSEQLSEVRIIPAHGHLWAEYVYQVPERKALGLDYSQGIGIDPGVSNWVTAVSSQGKSFIVCGRKIKSINQRYNKKVATQLGINLAEIGRESLTVPKRYDLSCLRKSYRKSGEMRLQTIS